MNNKRKRIIRGLGIVWAISIFLLIMQLYIMSKQIILIPLAFIAGFFFYWIHHKLSNIKKKWARNVTYAYAVVNFIPLILQFIGLKVPGADNIISALIGIILLRFNE